MTPDDFSSALEAAQHFVDISRWMNLTEVKVPVVEKIVLSMFPKLKIEFHCNDQQVFELPTEDVFFPVFCVVLKRDMDAGKKMVADIERQKKAEQFS